MTIELFLAHANDGRPVLPQGLSEELLRSEPIEPLPVPERLWSEIAGLDQLKQQRWGIVIPKGPDGERLLDLIQPLRQAREEAQGAQACVYRVAPGMDGPCSTAWKHETFLNEDVDETERPRYLLILGDLHQVSLELQQALSTDACVGRLSFRSPEGYASYVSKVLRWERTPPSKQGARMLFYTAADDSNATRRGYEDLIRPSIEDCQKRRQKDSTVEILDLADDGSAPGKLLLERAAEPRPSVLLSLSHGLGQPDGGWTSRDCQRELQGALLLTGEHHLSAADLASRPFLPGGMWFYFACFSAGTPARSTYAPWLRQISKHSPEVVRVLDTLQGWEGEQPFTAALPQAALANPEGPLAVMGHMDLTWTSSFSSQGRRTPSRFFGVLRALANSHRAGSSMRALLRSYNDLNMDLTAHDAHAALEGEAGRKVFTHPAAHARMWIQRQDLMGFVLLGDPAVRLPILPSEEES